MQQLRKVFAASQIHPWCSSCSSYLPPKTFHDILSLFLINHDIYSMIRSLDTLTCQKLSIAKCWKTENSTEFAVVSWGFHGIIILDLRTIPTDYSDFFGDETPRSSRYKNLHSDHPSHLCRAHAATDLQTSPKPDFYREITWNFAGNVLDI